jgi:TPR repeat protein
MCLDEDNFEEIKKLAFDYLKRSSSTDKYNKRMIELFEIASKNDDLDSLNLLGYFYLRGDIVTQDLNKSLEYYEKAQLLGDPSVKREISIIKNKLKELNA